MRIIFNSFKGHDSDFYVSLYKTYVLPILETASSVWSPYLISNIDNLESVQRYFTRRLCELRGVPYPQRLSLLNLDILEYRRAKADIVLYFKMLSGFTDVSINDSMRPHATHRGHSKNLYHFYSRTNVRKHFFVNRVVEMWNGLSQEIVTLQYYKFKKALCNVNFTGRGSIYVN